MLHYIYFLSTYKLFHDSVVVRERIGGGEEHDFVVLTQIKFQEAVDHEFCAASIALLNQ